LKRASCKKEAFFIPDLFTPPGVRTFAALKNRLKTDFHPEKSQVK
jgi:hypothetical protein